MTITRRTTLKLGLAAGAVAAVGPLVARASGTDSYDTGDGEIAITPVSHASFVMIAPDGTVIYNDPVGGTALYEGLPRPDLILLTHEHGDHFDPDTLSALALPMTRLVVNPAVFDKLPMLLKSKDRATSIGNGQSTTVGSIAIDAVPAYNTTADRLKYHPQGRDNGYVLTLGGKRVYIAGDTEDTPEMRAMKDIFVAFVPMNLPFTMDVNQAASAVGEFHPDYVYPYHYKGSDLDAFERLLAETGAPTKVVRGAWYG